MILIVDFGSQTAHLIGRRLKELGSPVKIIHPQDVLEEIKNKKPQGIVLSGGPSSVYEKGGPTIDPKIFSSGIPILGICYGLQLTAHILGGKVIPGKKEYGPARLELEIDALDTTSKIDSGQARMTSFWGGAKRRLQNLEIANDLPKSFTVWMSHGDEVVKLPLGFETLGSTEHVPFAFVQNTQKKIFGLQFHPEVEHTENGNIILQNFITICGISPSHQRINVEQMIQDIKKKVGDSYVIGAVSGGVDSTVAATLAASAIGKKFIPVYVDTGLMREGTKRDIEEIFAKTKTKPIVVDGGGEMLFRLKGVTDPERKRKIIGKFFIDMFEKEMEKLVATGKDVKFLLQGTIYSDVIESKGTKHADKIKSHHNVAGLPKNMKLKLLEPLRSFYKDEVRQIGVMLGLPDKFVYKQKFPGPGFGIRIRGEVTKERLQKAKQADNIILEELEKSQWLSKVFHSFPVMTGTFSTSVKGDGRFFGEVIALRITTSSDEMTSGWAYLPYDLLQKISSRIVNEVPGISRVVYDITTKPPATMEWE